MFIMIHFLFRLSCNKTFKKETIAWFLYLFSSLIFLDFGNSIPRARAIQ